MGDRALAEWERALVECERHLLEFYLALVEFSLALVECDENFLKCEIGSRGQGDSLAFYKLSIPIPRPQRSLSFNFYQLFQKYILKIVSSMQNIYFFK
jgi:hypothetical protein